MTTETRGRKRKYKLYATSRVCRLCDRTLSVSNFNPDRQRPDGYWVIESRCNDCKKAKKYGRTHHEISDVLTAQNHLCAICSDPLGPKRHIDHDHEDGRVRGVLCHGCNIGLGMFRDNPDYLRAAANYLA